MAISIAGRYANMGTPGTTERGKAERARQDELMQRSGGIVAYMMGCGRHHNSVLTAEGECGIMLRNKHHPDTPGTAA